MRDSIWEAMLDADMNVRYWGYFASRYVSRDKALKIFLAVMSSGAVASWGFWIKLDILWKLLSGFSAIIAIALPILNWQKTIELASILKGKWGQIENEYEMLWFTFENNLKTAEFIGSELRRIKKLENAAIELEGALSQDKRLIDKCQDEVMRSKFPV